MMVQLKIKHKRKFIMSQLKIMFDNFVWSFLLKQSMHIEISTKYTFIKVDNCFTVIWITNNSLSKMDLAIVLGQNAFCMIIRMVNLNTQVGLLVLKTLVLILHCIFTFLNQTQVK